MGVLEDFVAWLTQTKKECLTNGISDGSKRPRSRDNEPRTERRDRYEPYTRQDRHEPYSRRSEKGDRYHEHPQYADRNTQPYKRAFEAYGGRRPYEGRSQPSPPRILFGNPRERKQPTPPPQTITIEEKCPLGCSSDHEFQQCPKLKDQSQQERFASTSVAHIAAAHIDYRIAGRR